MKIGYCLTGSFCTFAKSLEALEALVRACLLYTSDAAAKLEV